jgi:hypothetical protein
VPRVTTNCLRLTKTGRDPAARQAGGSEKNRHPLSGGHYNVIRLAFFFPRRHKKIGKSVSRQKFERMTETGHGQLLQSQVFQGDNCMNAINY